MNSMSRVWKKSIWLLEIIPKTKRCTKKKSEKKEYDLGKETIRFLRHIDYARSTDLISKFSWAMKFHLHDFILQKDVWSKTLS